MNILRPQFAQRQAPQPCKIGNEPAHISIARFWSLACHRNPHHPHLATGRVNRALRVKPPHSCEHPTVRSNTFANNSLLLLADQISSSASPRDLNTISTLRSRTRQRRSVITAL